MVTEASGIFVGYIGPCVDIDDVKTTELEDLAKQKLETIGALAGGIAMTSTGSWGGGMFFTTKVSGTHGQGLFVVKRIVQSLHGAVRLKSAPGKGTTFRILLPAEHEMAQPTHNTISRADERC